MLGRGLDCRLETKGQGFCNVISWHRIGKLPQQVARFIEVIEL